MPQAYLLKGDFVECCDCFTVCPCWVSDLPDEDHCSGLYVWSFAEGSYIGNQDNSVAGMKVAAATYHAVRQGGQAFFYIDVNGGDPSMVDTLYQIFSDQSADHDLKGLANLLGLYLGHKPARIDANFGAKDFDVSVDTEGGHIATAKGEEKVFRCKNHDPAPRCGVHELCNLPAAAVVTTWPRLSRATASPSGWAAQFFGALRHAQQISLRIHSSCAGKGGTQG